MRGGGRKIERDGECEVRKKRREVEMARERVEESE